jgi:hypothetical protein
VDGQLRRVPSLESIVIRVPSGSASPSVREFVQGIEWMVY